MSLSKSAEEIVYLITGAAGFIGYFLSKRLLEQGCSVIGIDNMNDYYDVHLKHARLDLLNSFYKFHFVKGDIEDAAFIEKIFLDSKPDIVINLAAQAGVGYSAVNPEAYIRSNIVGFYNVLEACKKYPVEHLLYASSSSVYGANTKVPFEETDQVDNPVSLYAATKKSNELMAYTYSYLYNIPSTGLRFFSVYGPLGRPDMVYYLFVKKYFAGEPVQIFNNGDFENDIYRDYTYIDDIIDGIISLLKESPKDEVPHRIFNIGNNRPEKLMDFILALEKAFSRATGSEVQFKKSFMPRRPEDAPVTYASIDLIKKYGFNPGTTIEEGLDKFADWYVEYYKVK